jgi:hypothetical protein
VQFQNLAPNALGCELQLLLPGEQYTIIKGPSPSFDVWQVEREAGSLASWDMFVGKDLHSPDLDPLHLTVEEPKRNPGSGGWAAYKRKNKNGSEHDMPEVFGTVNGDPQAVELTRANGGVVVVNSTQCNETLTFHMGMKRAGVGPVVNYWDFVNVDPPASPVQGFRIVHSYFQC